MYIGHELGFGSLEKCHREDLNLSHGWCIFDPDIHMHHIVTAISVQLPIAHPGPTNAATTRTVAELVRASEKG